MTFTVEQFLTQFDGNYAQSALEARVEAVNEFMDTNPTFFTDILANFEEYIVDDDLRKDILYGNMSQVLNLQGLVEGKLYSSEVYGKYYAEKSKIEDNENAIKLLISNMDAIVKELVEEWVQQGNVEDTFNLATFECSAQSLEGLSDKAIKKKKNRVQSIENMEKRVIPDKQADIVKKTPGLVELEKAYREIAEWDKKVELENHLENAGWKELVSLHEQVMAKMTFSESGDGGFEKSLTDPTVKSQWYPNRVLVIRNNLVESGEKEEEINAIIERLEIKQNVHYVAMHTSGVNNNKRNWIDDVEQDIIIYDPETNIVYDCGEAKKNYFDMGHADMQIRRNKRIILGEQFGDEVVETKYPLYFDDTMVSSHIAETRRTLKTVKFTREHCEPLLNKSTGFIITSKPNDYKIHASSEVAVQIANWIYCSKSTDMDYVQESVDKLVSDLGIRDMETVQQSREVIIIG